MHDTLSGMAKRTAVPIRLPAAFFQNDSGSVPVREWLLSLLDDDRKTIGDDIRTAEFGWPIGMRCVERSLVAKVSGRSAAV